MRPLILRDIDCPLAFKTLAGHNPGPGRPVPSSDLPDTPSFPSSGPGSALILTWILLATSQN